MDTSEVGGTLTGGERVRIRFADQGPLSLIGLAYRFDALVDLLDFCGTLNRYEGEDTLSSEGRDRFLTQLARLRYVRAQVESARMASPLDVVLHAYALEAGVTGSILGLVGTYVGVQRARITKARADTARAEADVAQAVADYNVRVIQSRVEALAPGFSEDIYQTSLRWRVERADDALNQIETFDIDPDRSDDEEA